MRFLVVLGTWRAEIRRHRALYVVAAGAWVLLVLAPGVKVAPGPIVEGLPSKTLYLCHVAIALSPHGALPWSAVWRSSFGLSAAFLLMVLAMMLPAAAPVAYFVSVTTLRRRARRSVVLFFSGYLSVWMLFGVLFSVGAVLVLSARGAGTSSPLLRVVPILLAAVWQVTPLKQICRRAGHSPSPPPVRGLAADRAAFCFGLRHGTACVGTCWALMLSAIAVGGGSLLWMAVVTGISWLERRHRFDRKFALASSLFLAILACVYSLSWVLGAGSFG